MGDDFPSWALQPRKETGASQFIAKYPQYDGRGVIIAVFDSGIDPAAGGMQTTTDGKRKLIDRIDASGAGDVDTCTVVEVKDAQVTGITGRTLTIPSNFVNPTGKYHLGMKLANDLYPRPVVKDRVVNERNTKLWGEQHESSQAEAVKKQKSFQEAAAANEGGQERLGLKEQLKKENVEAEVEMAALLDKKFRDGSTGHWFSDPGPVYDCLVWHTGSEWRACIDISQKGELEKGLNLGIYRDTFEFGRLSDCCNVNVSVNIYDEGNLLEIVSMPSSHGTHVASIAAANFPEDPDKNGVAPGAQIVSINIGDGRLGSMESGTSLARAMSHILRSQYYKVDVINMSYGEFSHWSNTGRLGDLMNEVVSKHGVSWVASAGNNGPALCTLGTPPVIKDDVMIGVGAYVSPEMMTSMYSAREKLPGNQYTWTSRGPAVDGGRGVTVCAPGGAITSVPQFALHGTKLMNGTSMAAPNTTGSLALVLSAMRAQNLPWSPFSVKRALENSARRLENQCKYGQGNGLLDVEGTYTHLSTYSNSKERDVRFVVSCNGSADKGVHLRGLKSTRPSEVVVKVEPLFLDDQNRPAQDKLDFNLRLVLTCSAGWVQHSTYLDLMYTSRNFIISVDPTGLEPGIHSAYITAHDSTCPEKGKLFEIPIHVIRTEQLSDGLKPQVSHKVMFKPGEIQRHFLDIPSGATWATLKIKNLSNVDTGKFVVHTIQLVNKMMVRTLEHRKMISLVQDGEAEFNVAVRTNNCASQVIEFCLAKYWDDLGSLDIQYSVHFRGVLPSQSTIMMHGGEGIHRLDLKSDLSYEDIHPEIKLKSSVQVLRPTESQVVTLGSRDIIPTGRYTYEMQLQYSFSVPKATELQVNISMLSDMLYESELESQLWMLYDANKRCVGFGDAYPSSWALKVEKGDYTLRAHIRQEKRELLDRFADTPVLISSKLSSYIAMDVYTSKSEALVGGKKFGTEIGYPGKNVPVYIAPVNTDKHTKGATLGQFLQGTATFAKDEGSKKIDVYTIKYILPEISKKKDKNKEKDSKKNKTDDFEAYCEAVKDTKISWLAKLPANDQETQELYKTLVEEGVSVTSVHAARLQGLLAITDQNKDDNLVLQTADKVITSVDEKELLAWMGTKSDTRENAADVKKEMEKQKGHLLEALAAKGDALIKIGDAKETDLDDIYSTILKYCDPTDAKVIAFVVNYLIFNNFFAKALKLVVKQLDDKMNKDLMNQLIDLLHKMEWDYAARLTKLGMAAKFPPAYQPF